MSSRAERGTSTSREVERESAARAIWVRPLPLTLFGVGVTYRIPKDPAPLAMLGAREAHPPPGHLAVLWRRGWFGPGSDLKRGEDVRRKQ